MELTQFFICYSQFESTCITMASCVVMCLGDSRNWKLKRESNEIKIDSGKRRKVENVRDEKNHRISQTYKKPLSDVTSNHSQEKMNTSTEPSQDVLGGNIGKAATEDLDDSETVTYVNNLFSPVNKLQAIPLTLGELRRRSQHPEYFGRSEMVAYLRHSKTTGNDLVSRYDLKTKKQGSNVNVLSRLCEREAQTLASGIHDINCEYFPTDFVVEKMKNKMEDKKVDEKNVIVDVECDDRKKTVNSTM